ncbi:MAG TPA: PKD domain-containing protein [Solirubrobacteraceae bacterium]
MFTARYNTNSWPDIRERWIWNPTLAFGWPALQTDGAGDVGLVFRSSAENQNAQPVAGFLTPSEQFVFAEPAGLPHETGDYYSLRPGRTSKSFVMTAQTVETNASGGSEMHWEYVEYGHGPSPYVAPRMLGWSPAILWTEDGSVIGTGPTIHHTENTVGSHTITVKATNGDGKSASQSITIVVTAPVVTILGPNVAITARPTVTGSSAAAPPLRWRFSSPPPRAIRTARRRASPTAGPTASTAAPRRRSRPNCRPR